jgi:hypothetical protein
MGSPTAAGTVHGLEARRAHTRRVVTVASWLSREMDTLPNRELSRSGWTPVSAFTRTRSAVRPWELWLVTAYPVGQETRSTAATFAPGRERRLQGQALAGQYWHRHARRVGRDRRS